MGLRSRGAGFVRTSNGEPTSSLTIELAYGLNLLMLSSQNLLQDNCQSSLDGGALFLKCYPHYFRRCLTLTQYPEHFTIVQKTPARPNVAFVLNSIDVSWSADIVRLQMTESVRG